VLSLAWRRKSQKYEPMKECVMHDSARRLISKFYFDYKVAVDANKVADVGSLNINGAVKDIIHHAVGFDIVDGKGVDVVIKPGVIPAEHKNIYQFVICTSSFMCCPDPVMYKGQIIDLLDKNGILFLTMCSNKCQYRHTTSKNEYGYRDEFRLELRGLESFFSHEFNVLEIGETNYEHPDLFMVAKLK